MRGAVTKGTIGALVHRPNHRPDAEEVSGSLDVWKEQVRSCTACPLNETRIQAVTCTGPTPCAVMLVGEAPGEREDQTGVPFQGRSGKLLDETLERLGVSRDAVHIGNLVRCRPPANRPPKRAEVTSCAEHLRNEVGLVDPRVIVTLGASALRGLGLLGRSQALGEVRNENLMWEGRQVVATVHPAFVLRNPPLHALSFENDLRRALSLGGLIR